MVKYISIIILLCSITTAGESGRVLIFLKDKEANVPYALSQESIDRHYAKGLYKKLDDSDLPVSTRYIKQLCDTGVKIHQKLRWFNAVSGYAQADMLEMVKTLAFVDKIEPVKQFKFKLTSVEHLMEFQKPIDNIYGSSYAQNEMIGIPEMHNRGYFGQGVRIALFDTGFILNHEALQHIQVLARRDFIFNDSNVSNQAEDVRNQQNHGTEVLGIIGGYMPNTLVGPAYGATYLLAKTEDVRSETHVEEDNWAAAAEWADSIGVDIISTSLGYNIFDAGQGDYTYEDMDGKTTIVTRAAVMAVEKGIAVFVSAGNEGNNSWQKITAPADGDGVIAVGGLTPEAVYWPVSSQGPTFDGRIKPEVMAQGSGVFTVNPTGIYTYLTGGGTSFSCPLAAGAGAIVLSVNPNLGPLDLRNWLITTASQAENPDNKMGYGIVDLNKLYQQMISVPGVNISNFTVKAYEGRNKISWTVLQEISNKYWLVTRQGDNEPTMKEIGRLAGEQVNFHHRKLFIFDENLEPDAEYRYQLLAELDGEEQKIIDTQTIQTLIPKTFTLNQNYPNPFNSTTKFVLGIPAQERITLKIYDIRGRLIKTLLEERLLPTNYYVFSWDGRNDHGELLAGGVYYANCVSGNKQKTIKMIYLK